MNVSRHGRAAVAAALAGATLLAGCSSEPAAETTAADDGGARVCRDRTELRQALFGDLHVHTSFSFDAAANSTGATPAERGSETGLPARRGPWRSAARRLLAEAPRVLAIGLHPHLIGVPHRIGYLAQMLDLLMARDDTVFMTGSQIADWYAAAEPAPG